jgi:hypothetical protein
MAKGGRSSITVDFSAFEKQLLITMDRVERGTKKATIAACQEILRRSLQQVPRDTETLAKSAFYEVKGNRKNFVGYVGYGGNGDPRNPKTAQAASKYMVVVHEDLSAKHKVGKAKFLEDPVREYQKEHLARAANILRKETGIRK